MAARPDAAGCDGPPWRCQPSPPARATAGPSEPRQAPAAHCIHCDAASTRFRPMESRRPGHERRDPDGKKIHDRVRELCEAEFRKVERECMTLEEREDKGSDYRDAARVRRGRKMVKKG